MLNDDQIAEIRKRGVEEYCNGDHITYHGDVGRLLADRDELVRRLAKVREWAIAKPPSPHLACCPRHRLCLLCRGDWHVDEAECHAADCPAAPMEDAP